MDRRSNFECDGNSVPNLDLDLNFDLDLDYNPRAIDVLQPGTPQCTQSAGEHATRFSGSQSFVSQDLNPLQRWQNSPPETEPASVSAIVLAISNSALDLNNLDAFHSANGHLSRSSCSASSADSAGTLESLNSSASAQSQTSHVSYDSLHHYRGNKVFKRRRRRVSRYKAKGFGPRNLSQTCHTFQCTFCTETFKTKHNWQRHEKSLHLSLEQWECSPKGPTIMNEGRQLVCVYCGLPNPDESHCLGHNVAACKERSLEERIFYRKDHLRQHLRLVRDSGYVRWPMDSWKFEVDEIKSRCGFCGITMTTWDDCIDHLAAHFKAGRTMADWQGDWGFENHVINMVENSIPPCMY